jgi:hypothetical protein
MLPGAEGGDGSIGVLTTWQRQHDGLHIISRKNVMVVSDDTSRWRQSSRCLTGAGIRVCDGDQSGSGETLKNLEMHGLSDLSTPNQSNAYQVDIRAHVKKLWHNCHGTPSGSHGARAAHDAATGRAASVTLTFTSILINEDAAR